MPADQSAPAVYLTFDDGPHPVVTPFVLQQLQQFEALATFFMVGNNITKHPAIFDEVKNAGHTIGNHTYNHLNGYKTSVDKYLENVLKASGTIDGKKFRPPYGRINKKQALSINNAGLELVMWSLLSGDFDASTSSQKCLSNVINNIKPGDIVVFHDSEKAFSHLQFVLPKVLSFCVCKGWQMKGL